MIELIKIKNYALIEDSEIDLGDGLNIITGETGAGKSLFMNAIKLIMGEKAIGNLIGKNGKEASIEAIIKPTTKLEKRLKKIDIKLNDTVLIKRIFGEKNRCYINGEIVTLSQLKEVMHELIDICSQHENQSITNAEDQRKMLDVYAGNSESLLELKEIFRERKSQIESKGLLVKQKQETEMKMDYIEFRLKEIQDINPTEEDENIQSIIESIKQKDKIHSMSQNIDESFEVARAKLFEIYSDLKELDKIQSLDRATRVRDLIDQVKEVESETEIKFNDSVGEDVEYYFERNDKINKLKRKYGGSVASILQTKNELEEQMSSFDNFDVNLKKIDKSILDLTKKYNDKAKKISDSRKESAKKLAPAIKKHLVELNIPNAQFEIRIGSGEETEHGKDSVDFMISANRGEALGEMSEVASGGELSRVILAIHNVINENKLFYLFDEVDAGIGGDTGVKVGVKLKNMSQKNQLLCITHLPQVAAYADQHYVIKKTEGKDKTVSSISKLDKKQTEEEVARMLGSSMSGKALENAREMLQKAKKA